MIRHREKFRQFFLWVILVASLLAFVLMMTPDRLRALHFNGDFGQYWSAGQLNLAGKNPYDLKLLTEVQHPYAPDGWGAVTMWLPPWVYPLIMPIGALPYALARTVWFLGQLTLVFICANLLWTLYGGPKRWLWLAWIVSFMNWAMLEALRSGQVSPFILAGVIFFLVSRYQKSEWKGGVALMLVLLKPHLLYLFVLAVGVRAFEQRRWRLLAAWGCAVALGTILACLPNPSLLNQYIETAQLRPPEQWITATLGGQLRVIFGPEKFWLQFAPMLIGFAWLAWHWWHTRHSWDWLKETPLLGMVSLATAAYGWRHDQTLTLLAILPAFAWLVNSNRQTIWLKAIFMGIYVLINWIATTSQHAQDWYWWLPWVVILWFVIIRTIFYENTRTH